MVSQEVQKFCTSLKNVKVESYLISNPFSKLGNEDIGGLLSIKLFQEYFDVISLKTLERYAAISRTLENINKNAIFITGYRGCGKTTFARRLKALAEGSFSLTHEYQYDSFGGAIADDFETEILQNTVQLDRKPHGVNEESTSSLIDKISRILDVKYSESDGNIQRLNECINVINNKLKAHAIYINYEVGNRKGSNPIEEKLKDNFIKLVEKKVINTNRNSVIESIIKVYEKAKSRIKSFDKIGEPFVNNFFIFLTKQEVRGCSSFGNINEEFEEKLKPMSTDQLLMLIVLFDMFLMDEKDSKQKIMYLFDNIDVVYLSNQVDDFIGSFNAFLINIIRLLTKINELGLTKNAFNIYDDFCFIFLCVKRHQW